MAKYIYDKDLGQMVDKNTGAPMLTDAERNQPIQTPQIFGDFPGYKSPIDGKWIEGRRARKYDMESNGCVDANDFSEGNRGLKNERFAKKHGLESMLK